MALLNPFGKNILPFFCEHVLKSSFWYRTAYYSTNLSENITCENGPFNFYTRKIEAGQIYEDKHQKKVMDSLQRVYEDLKQYSGPKPDNGFFSFFSSKKTKINAPMGLYIHGSVGGGKTMLMDFFFDCVEINEKKRVHFNAFMLDVHARIHKLKKKASFAEEKTKPSKFDPIPPVAESILKECYLLCFDEFQVTDIGDAMILKRLFTNLFDMGCVVIATSNRPPDDLYKNGLQRSNFVPFIQVLKNHCEILPLNSGIDYRKRTAKNNATGHYFVNSDMNAKENPVDIIFKYLISKENDVVRSRTINIMGRNVTFNKTCGQILDTTYSELCERPLGSSDYLMLARSFHTIIIRDVPQIKPKIPGGRRFVTLIDNLYDSKIRIVISAAVPISNIFITHVEDTGDDTSKRMLMDDLGISNNSENASSSLFTGEEEIFSFERCQSRIVEMTTPEYWNKWDVNK